MFLKIYFPSHNVEGEEAGIKDQITKSKFFFCGFIIEILEYQGRYKGQAEQHKGHLIQGNETLTAFRITAAMSMHMKHFLFFKHLCKSQFILIKHLGCFLLEPEHRQIVGLGTKSFSLYACE